MIRNYINDAPQLALTTAINSAAVTLAVTSTAGFPAVPFTITLERGTVNQETVLCTAKTASTFTVTRAAVPKDHAIGASVEHTTEALDYIEANAHVNSTGDVHPQYMLKTAFGAKGQLLVGTGAAASVALAVGANDRVLMADSSQASGMRWGQIPSNMVTDGAITQGKLEDGVQRSLVRRQASYPTGPQWGEIFWNTSEARWKGFAGAWYNMPYGANRITFSQAGPSGGGDGDIWFRW